MLDFGTVALLLGAGFLGGLANSMAGGASLFTFPALVESGLSPILANATNCFALLPANSLGAIGDREKLPKRDYAFWLGSAATILGALVGAVLLLFTAERVFAILVPGLIGLATLIFTYSKLIQAAINRLIEGNDHPRLRAVLIFVTAIYCGYFGAGVGVMFMAVIGATTNWDLRTSNAYKNVLGALANFAAAILFALKGIISWPFAVVMLFGTAAGGFAGVQLIRILPGNVVRAIIIASGTLMTAIYIYRYWL